MYVSVCECVCYVSVCDIENGEIFKWLGNMLRDPLGKETVENSRLVAARQSAELPEYKGFRYWCMHKHALVRLSLQLLKLLQLHSLLILCTTDTTNTTILSTALLLRQ